jgi:hypothetical protein
MKTPFTAHPSPVARLVYITLVIGATIAMTALFIAYLTQQGTINRQVASLNAQTARLNVLAKQNHRALCAQKEDATLRVRRSTEFLSEHPHGIDGISRALVKQAISEARGRIDSLSDINCAHHAPSG